MPVILCQPFCHFFDCHNVARLGKLLLSPSPDSPATLSPSTYIKKKHTKTKTKCAVKRALIFFCWSPVRSISFQLPAGTGNMPQVFAAASDALFLRPCRPAPFCCAHAIRSWRLQFVALDNERICIWRDSAWYAWNSLGLSPIASFSWPTSAEMG